MWTSSFKAMPLHYVPGDWQLIKTLSPYENVKYQIDLVGNILDSRSREGTSPMRVRHFVVDPGIVHTDLMNALIGSFLQIIAVAYFFIVSPLPLTGVTLCLTSD